MMMRRARIWGHLHRISHAQPQPPRHPRRLSGVTLKAPAWAGLPELEKTVFRDTITDPGKLVARLTPFDAILAMRERTPFPRALIEKLPNLKLLMTTGERNRGIDAAACAEHGITFCGTSSFGAPTVEITWGLILNLMRGLPQHAESMKQGRWQASLEGGGVGRTVEGKVLGVIGLGKLGQKVARVGAAFGMKTIAWSQNLTAEAATAAGATLVSKAGAAGPGRCHHPAPHPVRPFPWHRRCRRTGPDEARRRHHQHQPRPADRPGGIAGGAARGADRRRRARCL